MKIASKKTIFYSLLTLSLIITSCSSNIPNTSINNNLNNKQRIDYNKYSNVIVKFNNNNGFKTKSVNFFNSNIKKLKVEIIGNDINFPISQTIDWTPGTPATFTIPVLAGKNRIVILSALDIEGNIISSLMGALNVELLVDNVANISYFETTVAQVLMSLKKNNTNILNQINLETLRNYLISETGYNPSTNSFNKIDPSKLNTTKIADSIIQNSQVPATGLLTDLETTGTLDITLNQTGVKLYLNDLNSSIIETSTNSSKIENITPGNWKLTIVKDEFVTQVIDIEVKDNIAINKNITLEGVNRFYKHITGGSSINEVLTPNKDIGQFPKIIVDSKKNMYFIDAKIGGIRKINGSTFEKSIIAEKIGFGELNGQFFSPGGSLSQLNIDSNDNLLFIAPIFGSISSEIRKLNTNTGNSSVIINLDEIKNLAIQGIPNTEFIFPTYSYTLDKSNNIYVRISFQTDLNYTFVYKIDSLTGNITNFLGKNNGITSIDNNVKGMDLSASNFNFDIGEFDKNNNYYFINTNFNFTTFTSESYIYKVDNITNTITKEFDYRDPKIHMLKILIGKDDEKYLITDSPNDLTFQIIYSMHKLGENSSEQIIDNLDQYLILALPVLNSNNDFYYSADEKIYKFNINNTTQTIYDISKEFSLDGKSALNVKLNPNNLAVDNNKNFYFIQENTVFKIDKNNVISKIAKGEIGGSVFQSIIGLDVDSYGYIHIFDNLKRIIYKLDSNGNIINQINLSSGDDPFFNPIAVTSTKFIVTPKNNIYFLDLFNIKKVDINGNITTVAGIDRFEANTPPQLGVKATETHLNVLLDFTLDSDENIYLFESYSDLTTFKGLKFVRKVDAKTGVITLFAGNITEGISLEPSFGDMGKATDALFTGGVTSKIAGDSFGNIYILDGNRIRKVNKEGIINTINYFDTVNNKEVNAINNLNPLNFFDSTSLSFNLYIDNKNNIYVTNYDDSNKIYKIERTN